MLGKAAEPGILVREFGETPVGRFVLSERYEDRLRRLLGDQGAGTPSASSRKWPMIAFVSPTASVAPTIANFSCTR